MTLRCERGVFETNAVAVILVLAVIAPVTARVDPLKVKFASPFKLVPVSYTHLTLPTNREV